VLDGARALSSPTEAEQKAFLHGMGRAPDAVERLACHARVIGSGARVRVRKVWTLADHRGS
jgi:hypothetical protein